MKLRWTCLSGGLAIAAGLAFGPPQARADEKGQARLADLSGHWKVNKDLSDAEPAAVGTSGEGQGGHDGSNVTSGRDSPGEDAARREGGRHGGGSSGGARTGRTSTAPGSDDDPRGARRTAEPQELTITQTELEIVVEEKPGQTRNLYPNGKTYKADEGASQIKTSWRDGALVVEKKNVRGWKLTETWQLSPDRSRLGVDLRLEGGSRPRMSLKRVYDRVPGS